MAWRTWSGGIASRYVEQFDLFSPEEFAARNEVRRRDGDQKQLAISDFDQEILRRARAHVGILTSALCHPSTMFQLLRQFWLGNDSLQSVLDYTEYERPSAIAAVELPKLPDTFVAVKFYAGRALMDTPAHRERLRQLVERISRRCAVVALNTNLSLDEHADYVFRDVPGLITLDGWLTPHNNLAVQTEVIRRATRFVGTCGSLAWLAPMLGTDTLAVYADDHFLTPAPLRRAACVRLDGCRSLYADGSGGAGPDGHFRTRAGGAFLVSRKSVIVTGGAGFIGSELVRQLGRRGVPVVVIDNLINGKRENLADVQGGVTLLEHDIRDVSAYARILRDADVVYHLACLGVRHSVHSPRRESRRQCDGHAPAARSEPRAPACRSSSTSRARRSMARRNGCP